MFSGQGPTNFLVHCRTVLLYPLNTVQYSSITSIGFRETLKGCTLGITGMNRERFTFNDLLVVDF